MAPKKYGPLLGSALLLSAALLLSGGCGGFGAKSTSTNSQGSSSSSGNSNGGGTSSSGGSTSSGGSSSSGGNSGGTNHGSNLWALLPDPFNNSYKTVLRAIVIAPNGTIYVGGDGGVAVSSNGGQSWTLLNNGLPNLAITALGFNSLGELIAGVGLNPAIGAFRYTGGKWQPASGINASLAIWAFTLDSTGALLAVTAWAGDVFRSTDNGATYTKVAATVGSSTPGASAGALFTIIKAPDGALYTGGESGGGIYRSTDNGSTWQQFGLSNAQGYTGNLKAIGYNAANEILAGRPSNGTGVDLQRYTGGAWTASSTGLSAFFTVTSIQLNPKGELFASLAKDNGTSSSGGVFLSTDNGQHWQSYTDGLPSAAVEKLALDPSGYLFAITNSGQTPGTYGFYKSLAIP